MLKAAKDTIFNIPMPFPLQMFLIPSLITMSMRQRGYIAPSQDFMLYSDMYGTVSFHHPQESSWWHHCSGNGPDNPPKVEHIGSDTDGSPRYPLLQNHGARWPMIHFSLAVLGIADGPLTSYMSPDGKLGDNRTC